MLTSFRYLDFTLLYLTCQTYNTDVIYFRSEDRTNKASEERTYSNGSHLHKRRVHQSSLYQLFPETPCLAHSCLAQFGYVFKCLASLDDICNSRTMLVDLNKNYPPLWIAPLSFPLISLRWSLVSHPSVAADPSLRAFTDLCLSPRSRFLKSNFRFWNEKRKITSLHWRSEAHE